MFQVAPRWRTQVHARLARPHPSTYALTAIMMLKKKMDSAKMKRMK